MQPTRYAREEIEIPEVMERGLDSIERDLGRR
jgi:hypothetical protein